MIQLVVPVVRIQRRQILILSHIVDRKAELVSLLSTTSMYICNIEPSNDADTISLKDSLKSTINDLLTEIVTGGVTIDKAVELQLQDSPIRSVEG